MAQEKANYSIVRMARVLEVSTSGYYDWANRVRRGPTLAEQRRQALTEKIRGFHDESDGVYGSPRIHADLVDDGEIVSGKTVAKLMRNANIVGIRPRKFVVTTIAGPDNFPVPDRVKRIFDPGELNKVWLCDITYLRTDQGWVYLCAIRDGHSRRVLGYSIDDHMRADLVETALRMAVTLRSTLPGKVIFHGDRGTQYTSTQIAEVAKELKILRSMGRTGICWDNAMAESFWSTLKTGYYNRHHWKNKTQVRQGIGTWIEERYNRKRRHSALGMLSPVDYETQTAKAA